MSTSNWHECVVDNDYEISDVFPYNIRRKKSARMITISVGANGYLYCRLNNKKYLHHRLVALQFIENDDPDNKTDVDHRDHVRTNNNITNLRWVTRSQNIRNRSNVNGRFIEFFDEIPDDAIAVTKYNSHVLENHYYSSAADSFYCYDQELNSYRKLCVSITNKGCEIVSARDVDGKQFAIVINKFKREYL